MKYLPSKLEKILYLFLQVYELITGEYKLIINQKNFAKNFFPHVHIIRKKYLLDCVNFQLPLFIIEDYNLTRRKKTNVNNYEVNHMTGLGNYLSYRKDMNSSIKKEPFNSKGTYNKQSKILKFYQ